MKKTINIAMIGGGFMGKAHSNAWLRVNEFFDTPYKPVLKVIAGKNNNLDDFKERWGYEEITYDWRTLLERDDIDIIDIVTPTFEHKEMAIAAAKAGKHIVCEKPFALSYEDSCEMLAAAEEAGIIHYLNHNYRRVPAVAYAKKLMDDGRLGEIYHWRGVYLQDWITDPNFPLTWHLRKETAGGGPLYDLTSHALDLARFFIGEPVAVTAVNKTFVNKRPLPGEGAATFSAGSTSSENPLADVTVDDASFAIIEFENNILGSIESSRFATGRKNQNTFEIYGSKGSLRFDLERMNELEFFDATQDLAEQGFKRILVTESVHPYMSAWWPPGHVIGYEHTFVNAFYDYLNAIANKQSISPNFEDGCKIIKALEAIKLSGDKNRRVELSEIK